MKAQKKNLGERTWVLKTCGTSWYVKIKRRGREYFFRKADWEEFAKHHGLHYGDQVMVFLVGKSEFEVLLYSRTTCCQILPPQPVSSEDQEFSPPRNGKKCKRKPIRHDYDSCKKTKRSGIIFHPTFSSSVSVGFVGIYLNRLSNHLIFCFDFSQYKMRFQVMRTLLK